MKCFFSTEGVYFKNVCILPLVYLILSFSAPPESQVKLH